MFLNLQLFVTHDVWMEVPVFKATDVFVLIGTKETVVRRVSNSIRYRYECYRHPQGKSNLWCSNYLGTKSPLSPAVLLLRNFLTEINPILMH